MAAYNNLAEKKRVNSAALKVLGRTLPHCNRQSVVGLRKTGKCSKDKEDRRNDRQMGKQMKRHVDKEKDKLKDRQKHRQTGR